MSDPTAESGPRPSGLPDSQARFHVRFGWVVLAVSLILGLVLELLHGFRIDWYLDVGVENRRLMFTLTHAHASLLAVLNLVFVATARWLAPGLAVTVASWALRIGTILLPAGFFLAGLVLAGADPGFGIFLAPVGGAAVIVAVVAAGIASFQTPTR